MRQLLDRVWYADAPVPWYLLLGESIYRIWLCWRRLLYRRGILRSERVGFPLLVVGNLTVGGTGKTPLVAAIVTELRQRGWQPGIVLRGYGGRARGPLLVHADSAPDEVGDEAVLLSRCTCVPVAIGADRVAAAQLLSARGDCNLIVSDDGLQHWAMARDVEIVVVDGQRRFGNGRLLPAGPLREQVAKLGQVDLVVCNGAEPEPGEFPMQMVGHRAISLGAASTQLALTSLRGRRVHAVAGIGNPSRFFAMLSALGIKVDARPLPDHHRFSGDELQFDDDDLVLVTEKDAVKCARFATDKVYMVPVEAQLGAEFYDRLNAASNRSSIV